MTDKQPNIVQMLQPGGIVPIDMETTAALVTEVKRLREALKDIARQPEGDEDSAQEVARTALKETP